MAIYRVVDPDDALSVVQPMKAPDILLQRAFPGNRHCYEQRVQSSIVKALSYVVARMTRGASSGTAAMASATDRRCLFPMPPLRTNTLSTLPASVVSKYFK